MYASKEVKKNITEEKMTCFWKGLLDCLRRDDFALLQCDKPSSEQEFVRILQHCNRKAEHVTWQDIHNSDQFLHECMEAVQTLDRNTIYQGYWCSTCDPFLLLVSEVFQITIEHSYCGHLIVYKYSPGARKTIRVRSNRGHFQKA